MKTFLTDQIGLILLLTLLYPANSGNTKGIFSLQWQKWPDLATNRDWNNLLLFSSVWFSKKDSLFVSFFHQRQQWLVFGEKVTTYQWCFSDKCHANAQFMAFHWTVNNFYVLIDTLSNMVETYAYMENCEVPIWMTSSADQGINMYNFWPVVMDDWVLLIRFLWSHYLCFAMLYMLWH